MNQQINIIYEIKSLDNALNRKVLKYAKEKNIPFILSPVQLKIINYLYKYSKETIYQKDIENIIESRRSTTSGILNTMEKNNIIKRESTIGDARTKQIIITNYGILIAEELQKCKNKFEAIVQENISPQELETFLKVTNKIKNNIINMK